MYLPYILAYFIIFEKHIHKFFLKITVKKSSDSFAELWLLSKISSKGLMYQQSTRHRGCAFISTDVLARLVDVKRGFTCIH